MKKISRREMIQLSLAGAGTLLLPRLGLAALPRRRPEPHFFLQVLLNGGADASYLFDARPLSMTAAGKIHNYLGSEPKLWTGRNGGTCWATRLTDALKPHRDHLSVLNGVVMDAGANGHPQNMNYLYTGDSFGGESFIPHLNATDRGTANIDAIQNGSIFASLTNTGAIVEIDADSSDALKKKLRDLPPANPGDELLDFVRSRLQANSAGPGRVAAGARELLVGFDHTPDLEKKLLGIPAAASAGLSSDRRFIDLVSSYFRAGIAKSAIWVFPESFDVHDPDLAKSQPKKFKDAADRLALLFHSLRTTPYDRKRSILDVTTVMVASEFSRTMKNPGYPVDDTGTNHNQLTNSVLLAGKGIRGGLVLGKSDFQTADAQLSAAHKSLDAELLQIMGQPFDFASMRPRDDLPATYDVKHYLTIGSVVNTLYSLFGVPGERYRNLGRNEPLAPLLPKLLS